MDIHYLIYNILLYIILKTYIYNEHYILKKWGGDPKIILARDRSATVSKSGEEKSMSY